MKFLVLFAVVASASAQLVAYPNGAVAPVETADVQLAKAAHFAAHGAISPYAYAAPYAYNGLGYNGLAYNGLGYNNLAYNGLAYNGLGYAAGLPLAYNNFGYGGLVAHPNGAVVPVDEPAVQAAKAEHFAAHGLPLAATYAAAPYAYAANYAYSGLVAHPNGAVVPVEPADVVAARAEHLAAVAAA
jgi:hypothetical protein